MAADIIERKKGNMFQKKRRREDLFNFSPYLQHQIDQILGQPSFVCNGSSILAGKNSVQADEIVLMVWSVLQFHRCWSVLKINQIPDRKFSVHWIFHTTVGQNITVTRINWERLLVENQRNVTRPVLLSIKQQMKRFDWCSLCSPAPRRPCTRGGKWKVIRFKFRFIPLIR